MAKPKDIWKVLGMVYDKYIWAKDNPMINDPIGWALYHVWDELREPDLILRKGEQHGE